MSKSRSDVIRVTWIARDYQKPLFRYFRNGGKRAVAIWHRRAGKDSTAVEITKEQSLKTPGVYWHMLPTLKQGRQVIWDGRNKDGTYFLDHWPGWRLPGRCIEDGTGIVKAIRHDEMKIELANGSLWQVVGSDNYDSLVGSNPRGIIMSEYAVADPTAWEFIRPILAENNGFAIFPYTPRGRNHGYALYEMARDNEAWFCELLTVDDTGAISPEAVNAERKAGMPEELVQQEFYCSFDAPLVGAIFADQMWAAEREGRITAVHYDASVLVDTWWDLGRTDFTSIWFVQHVGNEIHLIDHYRAQGKELPHYADLLRRKEAEGYRYGVHVYPHDAAHKRLGMGGKSIAEQMTALGFAGRVQAASDIWDGIQEVRAAMPRMYWDRKRCGPGIEALKSYRKEEDERRSTIAVRYFKETPYHDWASHDADAMRTGVVSKLRGQTVLRQREDYAPAIRDFYRELDRSIV